MERCREHIPQKINKCREHKTLDDSLKVQNNELVVEQYCSLFVLLSNVVYTLNKDFFFCRLPLFFEGCLLYIKMLFTHFRILQTQLLVRWRRGDRCRGRILQT